jgi:hypothetical protein
MNEKDYKDDEFEDSSKAGKTQKPPGNTKKAGSDGLSITRLGRLSLTTKIQKDMGIEKPDERDVITYVKVLLHKATEGYDRFTFQLKFYDDPQEYPSDQLYKLYKPKRREKFGTPNDTSYFEFARFLKLKGILDKVGDAGDKIDPGPVEIKKRDIDNRTLVINLSERIKIQE